MPRIWRRPTVWQCPAVGSGPRRRTGQGNTCTEEATVDFTLRPYTEEQTSFRQEVRAWLEQTIPEEMKRPIDMRGITQEQYLWWREMRKKLAAKGWLYPTYSKQYGGGGLTGEHETILDEEFDRAGTVRGWNNGWAMSAILVWGTEEQRQRFLKPLVTGEKITWYKLTEPQSGADLAGIQTRAERDGDDWLITGQNVFISGENAPGFPDLLFGPAITDPNAPRHRNMGVFMIPVPSKGLEIRQMNLLGGNEQHFIFLDHVRVPGDHLIGGDHQGWQVAMSAAEQEHGGRGQAFPRDPVLDNLVSYARNTKRNGSTLGKDPMVQQTTMQAYLEAHVGGLLARRTFWMYNNRMEVNHEGAMANVHGREHTLRNAIRVRDVMGMYASLGTRDPLAPHSGAQDVSQRGLAGQHHAGGSTNIMKVILARRIGISRTKERPAVTPSSAGLGG
ncbi:MAG: acyl-CoA dehydrogenase [Dehalococcoidia bacterium]|nr:acyl-CoA dehydrogenase [Dehalococcoidia bacterium]